MCFGPEFFTVLQGVGTAMSVLGAFQQDNAQANMYEYQAEMDRRQAAAEKDAALASAEKIRKATKLQRGEATEALAASGVSLSEGTPILIDRDIADRGEQDAFAELLTGSRKADSLYEQARMNKSAASDARASSVLAAGSEVLKGWKFARPSSNKTSTGVPGGPATPLRIA